MYALGAFSAYLLTKWIIQKKNLDFTKDDLENVVLSAMLGGVLGGRLFYVFVYNWDFFSQKLGQIFAVWNGGMSIHGGLIGGALGAFLYCRWKKLSFFEVTDAFVPGVALGLAFGRFGNFVNGELPGRETDMPWGMVYGGEYGDEMRHPWPLYAIIKDLILCAILLWFSLTQQLTAGSKKSPLDKGGLGDSINKTGILSAIFLILLALFRFTAEFFRYPDGGVLYYGLSKGQWLSVGLFVVGVSLFLLLCFQRKKN